MPTLIEQDRGQGRSTDGPPPLLDGPGGGGARWVELITAQDDIEAHLLTGRLGEAGIETRTVKDRSGPAWLHGGSNPWAPVSVLVKRIQLEDARLVLVEISWGQPAVDPEALAPASPAGTRGALVWWAAAILLGVTFTSVALARTADVLEGCSIPLICGGPTESAP